MNLYGLTGGAFRGIFFCGRGVARDLRESLMPVSPLVQGSSTAPFDDDPAERRGLPAPCEDAPR